MNDLIFREYNPETDKDFLMASWINKMSNAGTLLSMQEDDEQLHTGLNFNRRQAIYQHIFSNVLKRKTIQIIVLCNKEYTNQIIGTCVYEKQESSVCLHWVYVKEMYQKNGFGSQMISVATQGMNKFSYTCQTKLAKQLIDKHDARNLVDWVPQKLFSNHGCFKSREEEIEQEKLEEVK